VSRLGGAAPGKSWQVLGFFRFPFLRAWVPLAKARVPTEIPLNRASARHFGSCSSPHIAGLELVHEGLDYLDSEG
jgi:hypothetical protein